MNHQSKISVHSSWWGPVLSSLPAVLPRLRPLSCSLSASTFGPSARWGWEEWGGWAPLCTPGKLLLPSAVWGSGDPHLGGTPLKLP